MDKVESNKEWLECGVECHYICRLRICLLHIPIMFLRTFNGLKGPTKHKGYIKKIKHKVVSLQYFNILSSKGNYTLIHYLAGH